MAQFRQCEFFLLRYVPDVVKGEFVNLGVVLLEEGDDGFTDVRFIRDWRRVRGLDPEADIELLESYEAELRSLLQSHEREIINYREPMSRREWLLAQMQQSFSGALEITPMTAVLTESPQAEIGMLAQTYLESSARGHRDQAGRRAIYNTMRDAFEKAGVWQSPAMRKDIAVAQYTRRGDPLKIDCGYRVPGSQASADYALDGVSDRWSHPSFSCALTGDRCELGQGAGVQLYGNARRSACGRARDQRPDRNYGWGLRHTRRGRGIRAGYLAGQQHQGCRGQRDATDRRTGKSRVEALAAGGFAANCPSRPRAGTGHPPTGF